MRGNFWGGFLYYYKIYFGILLYPVGYNFPKLARNYTRQDVIRIKDFFNKAPL